MTGKGEINVPCCDKSGVLENQDRGRVVAILEEIILNSTSTFVFMFVFPSEECGLAKEPHCKVYSIKIQTLAVHIFIQQPNEQRCCGTLFSSIFNNFINVILKFFNV